MSEYIGFYGNSNYWMGGEADAAHYEELPGFEDRRPEQHKKFDWDDPAIVEKKAGDLPFVAKRAAFPSPTNHSVFSTYAAAAPPAGCSNYALKTANPLEAGGGYTPPNFSPTYSRPPADDQWTIKATAAERDELIRRAERARQEYELVTRRLRLLEVVEDDPAAPSSSGGHRGHANSVYLGGNNLYHAPPVTHKQPDAKQPAGRPHAFKGANFK
ncbi:hypothetical protein M3Y99_00030100 [Aphelenchoides fujianensis]|nr:hypothetical protein M3Y99_00030100 [Aphelenchoides fujianensis]